MFSEGVGIIWWKEAKGDINIDAWQFIHGLSIVLFIILFLLIHKTFYAIYNFPAIHEKSMAA